MKIINVPDISCEMEIFKHSCKSCRSKFEFNWDETKSPYSFSSDKRFDRYEQREVECPICGNKDIVYLCDCYDRTLRTQKEIDEWLGKDENHIPPAIYLPDKSSKYYKYRQSISDKRINWFLVFCLFGSLILLIYIS